MEEAKNEMMGNAEDEAHEEKATRDAEKVMDSLHEQALEDNEKLNKAKREAELAEQQRLDAENSAKEAAEVLERLKNGNIGSTTVEKTENGECSHTHIGDFTVCPKLDPVCYPNVSDMKDVFKFYTEAAEEDVDRPYRRLVADEAILSFLLTSRTLDRNTMRVFTASSCRTTSAGAPP